MLSRFTVGDVLRKARLKKKWNQEMLGHEAERFPLPGQNAPIGKNTVSNAELRPYNCKFGTILRLAAALGLSISELERITESPFLEQSVKKEARRPLPG